MKTEFQNGAIRVRAPFQERVKYDVSNHRITAQFDGVGGVSKYAVMNKFSVFSSYYCLFSVDGRAYSWDGEKTVTMIGRTQVTEFEVSGVHVKLRQFLDERTNAIFTEAEVVSDRNCRFDVTINFGTDFASYVLQLLSSRLKPSVIASIVGGMLKKKRSVSADGSYLLGNVMGDFYLDVACNAQLKGLESERGYYNQFAFGDELVANTPRIFRYVLSAGTRTDFTFADVREELKNFDSKAVTAKEYCDMLVAAIPKAADTESKKAEYVSCLNCSLSNYKELGKFKGFLAGIVYQFPARTYYRDAYWTVLSVLPVAPQLVRNEIFTLARGVSSNGDCASAVRYNFKNHWGNHFDSPSFFVMMVYDYVSTTGDGNVLSEKIGKYTVLELVQKVLDKLSKKADETGLLVKDGDYNRRDWCDNVFRGGYVTYDEALYARANYCLSELLKKSGNVIEARRYAEVFERVKQSINSLLWDEEKGWYVNYSESDYTETNLSIDTIVCVLYGIADSERALRVLKNMERLLESKNNLEQQAGDFGVLSVYPFYGDARAIVQKSSLPYYYHNGGDWPYLTCMYAYAKRRFGLDMTYPLTRWFEYNLSNGNFTPVEFFAPPHPDGSLLQAWSSTGAFALSYADEDFFAKTVV